MKPFGDLAFNADVGSGFSCMACRQDAAGGISVDHASHAAALTLCRTCAETLVDLIETETED